MARQPDIRYVQFYTYGSAAQKLEPVPKQKKKVQLPKPKAQKEQQRVVYVDPLALCAMAAAVVLLIAMVVGMIRLGANSIRSNELQTQVTQLQQENASLKKTFLENYDAESVEEFARINGMISAAEAEHVPLEYTIPQAEQEPGFWENVGFFFSELFA